MLLLHGVSDCSLEVIYWTEDLSVILIAILRWNFRTIYGGLGRNPVGIGLSYRAGILEHSTGTRNRLGKGLPYRPARLHRLAELISWNRFLCSLKVLKYRLRPPRLHWLEESIPGLLKSLKIRAQCPNSIALRIYPDGDHAENRTIEPSSTLQVPYSLTLPLL
jgi:hypothetical protein